MLTVAEMSDDLGPAIKKARKGKGMTLKQVAAELGVSYPAVQQWESGKTSPSTVNLLRLSKVIDLDLSSEENALRWIGQADDEELKEFFGSQASEVVARIADSSLRSKVDRTVTPNVDLSKAEDLPNFRPFGGPRNVPEYGSTAGGKRGDADFRLNGQTVDYAPRLPGIANKKDVYTLRVVGESMEPKYEEGERIYVDPHRQPAVMDYVVIELHADDDTGEPGDSYIKRLVRRTPTKFVVLQYNPKKEIEFERDEVKNFHRVIPNDELFGV